ncbi:MAG: DinB family protein [Acidobacteria bacterium]|nr:DinB family protein [Acidobacteriota bacterium]
MDRFEIIDRLRANYGKFADLVASMPEKDFTFSLGGEKWTAGQQTDHLCRSLAPLNDALKMPALVLKTMFGAADHITASYDELVARYQDKLAAGGKASPRFTPEAITFGQRDELLNELRSHLEKLCSEIEMMDEPALDKLMLPHPLIGKLTLREMFYFTIYHAEHHHLRTAENLSQRTAF